MMTNQELILGVMRAQGKADALDLRARAPELDGTALRRCAANVIRGVTESRIWQAYRRMYREK